MATKKSMTTVDKITAAISGTLAAAFFTLAGVAAFAAADPAPVVADATP